MAEDQICEVHIFRAHISDKSDFMESPQLINKITKEKKNFVQRIVFSSVKHVHKYRFCKKSKQFTDIRELNT